MISNGVASEYDLPSKKVEIWDRAYTSPKTVRETIWDIYQQGRADKYQEIVSEYMLLTEEQVAEIRADAIEEYRQRLNNAFEPVEEHEQMELEVVIADVNRLAKVLKEQKND